MFDEGSQPAYCDHWVSNVHSRTKFLKILEDTLGFTPKVDFNAGVVAAGEAQIESTVTGNTSIFEPADKAEALRDQSQVFLPINNALSSKGHVHGFLEEIGQGVQHIASRVDNLVGFVEYCNQMRAIAGEGFTFLDIPRSYYGVLTVDHVQRETAVSKHLAIRIVRVCEQANIISMDGAVDLDLSIEKLSTILDSMLGDWEDCLQKASYEENKNSILSAIMSSRYCNVLNLLQGHVSESTYMRIVRNQVLVDVQGGDILYQIFTCKILHRRPAEEAPFLEFIQRVCSEYKGEDGCPKKIKPGCGGFGIRNFLTLFLSIEVSKAIRKVHGAQRKGEKANAIIAQRRVSCLTSQFNDSNPILSEISDSMTEESTYQMQMETAHSVGDQKMFTFWRARFEQAGRKKREANAKLMACSARYEKLMRSIRGGG